MIGVDLAGQSDATAWRDSKGRIRIVSRDHPLADSVCLGCGALPGEVHWDECRELDRIYQRQCRAAIRETTPWFKFCMWLARLGE